MQTKGNKRSEGERFTEALFFDKNIKSSIFALR